MVTIPKNVNARAPQLWNTAIPKDNLLVTRKKQIMARFPDVFEGIGKFLGKPYKIQLDQIYHPNKPLAGLSQYISRKPSRQKSTKCSRQVFLNPYRIQHNGSIALCSSKVLTNKVSPSSGYV